MGKDSLATVILALMHHEPLDEIVYCEVMFDKEISGEVPEHRTFIYETAIPWLRRAGLNVKILRANTTYKECFTKTIQRGKGKGKLKGFPLCGRCNIQRDLYAVHLKPNCCVACFNCVRFTPSLPMCTTCPTSTISTSNP